MCRNELIELGPINYLLSSLFDNNLLKSIDRIKAYNRILICLLNKIVKNKDKKSESKWLER